LQKDLCWWIELGYYTWYGCIFYVHLINDSIEPLYLYANSFFPGSHLSSSLHINIIKIGLE